MEDLKKGSVNVTQLWNKGLITVGWKKHSPLFEKGTMDYLILVV